jgi:hypothetical protein
VSIRLLNRHTRNPIRSCISRSTSQSHPLSDSISQRASLFTYHLVRAGYSPVPSSRFTLITAKTLDSSPTDYVSSGSGSEHRIVTCAELATDPIQLKSSRACHRHVTLVMHSLSRLCTSIHPLRLLSAFIPCVHHVHLDPSIAPLYLLRYSTADLSTRCRHSGQTPPPSTSDTTAN